MGETELRNHNSALTLIKTYMWDIALFVFNLLTAFAIVLGLVILIFTIRPHNAFISAELENNEFELPTWTASDMDVVMDDSALMGSVAAIVSPENGDSVAIRLSGFTIDGMTVPENATLMLTPADEYGLGPIILKGNIARANCFSASIVDSTSIHNGMSIPHSLTILSNNPTFFSNDDIVISFTDSALASIRYENGEDLPIEGGVQTLTLRDKFAEDFITQDGKPEVDVDKEKTQPSILTGLTLELIPTAPSASLAVFLSRNARVSSDEVSNLVTTSSGKLTMSYTPHPEEYILHGQELNLTSSDGHLACAYDGSKHTLSCSGHVQSAYLSGMNLFPDFWSWYYSNSYIAPFTIISSVIAAHAQFTSHRKERDSRRKTEGELTVSAQ